MKTYNISIILLLFALAISACKTNGDNSEGTDINPEKSQQRNSDFLRYMENEETEAKDLESIVRYGKDIFPLLEMTLNAGPSVARLQTYEIQLARQYDAVYENSKYDPPYTKEEYVKQYLDKYTTNYKLRAVEVLDNISGGEEILSGYLNKSVEQEDVVGRYIKEVLEGN